MSVSTVDAPLPAATPADHVDHNKMRRCALFIGGVLLVVAAVAAGLI
jgi:hypothetical protein